MRVRANAAAVIVLILLTAALILLVGPSFLDAVTDIYQVQRIGAYNEAEDTKSSAEYQKELEDAEAYNAEVYARQQKSIFTYQGADIEDHAYENALSGAGGVMCSVEIPQIHVNLPVVHGTRSKDLETNAGHMYGSSLPIGGESTHAVIAGHTGLPGAALFTDLIDLKKGDVFYINIHNEKHAYTVDQIKVILPEEEYRYLQIEDGKDYVTLYTCTPYGINDHRLLVRGVRTPDRDQKISAKVQRKEVHSIQKCAMMKAILLGAVPVMPVLLYISIGRHKKKKTAEAVTTITTDEGSSEEDQK